jgi:Tfp pilus assembly protein PilO
MRLAIPIILVAAAVGLFALYTNGTYQDIKTLQTQVGAFNQALDTAQSLRQQRDALISKRNTFSADDVQKLERILPDNVDNIRFVIDINNIAARHKLSLKNVSLGTVSDSKTQRGALAVGASGDPVGSAEIGFSLTASYDDYIAFLQDLEHSLRLVDVEKISFKPATGANAYEFSMTIKTYWLH